MRNIPVFSTDLGVASLILDQIPYSGTAYVHIRDTACACAFIEECAQFCRAAGAQTVLATGHEVLDTYPLAYEILTMSGPLASFADKEASLMPVTEDTLNKWVAVYNERMGCVDGAAFMSTVSCKQLLEAGDGYFVHSEGTLLGIGKASGETIEAIASVVPGAGEQVFLALCHALCGPMVRLQVASTNAKARHLYEKLGLILTGACQTWHKIL